MVLTMIVDELPRDELGGGIGQMVHQKSDASGPHDRIWCVQDSGSQAGKSEILKI